MTQSKKSLENAFSDILIIKSSIEQSKIIYNSFDKILFVYGLTNLIYFIFSIIIRISIPKISYQSNLISVVNKIVFIFFFVYYIKLYIKERSLSNKYYISFLNIWLGVVILFPLFQAFTRIIISFTNISAERIGEYFLYLNIMDNFSNILLLFFCIVISSCILNNNGLKYLSFIILFSYILIFSIFIDSNITFANNITISLPEMYYYIIMPIVYIVISLLLKRGVKNGFK